MKNALNNGELLLLPPEKTVEATAVATFPKAIPSIKQMLGKIISF
jgi:hypothetical protein